MYSKQIEPSLLAFNKEIIPSQLIELKKIGIRTIHYDVMDGYVNNQAFDNEWIESILALELNVNVHLMVFEPLKWIERFCRFPISTLTFQFEAMDSEISVVECLEVIRGYGVKAGIAIKPTTLPNIYINLLGKVDVLTIMTVEPGQGGQNLISSALTNLQYVSDYRKKYNLNYLIEVDGGIKLNNYLQVIDYSDYIISGTGFMQLSQEQQISFMKAVENYDGEKYE